MCLHERVFNQRIIVIVRGIYGQELEFLAQTLVEEGLNAIEVTFDSSDPNGILKTASAIETLKSISKSLLVGAGTVLSIEQLHAAQSSGAEFIISPNVDEQVIQETKRRGLISVPGAMTASEIFRAHEAGADIVKIFPAAIMGTNFIKQIKAPLSCVEYLAAGGVNHENIREMLESGYSYVGIGSYLAHRSLLDNKDRGELRQRARNLISIVRDKK